MNLDIAMKRAIECWNYGQQQEAQLVFDALYKRRDELDYEAKKQMGHYYASVNDYKRAYELLKRTLETQSDSATVALFLKCIKGGPLEAQDLLWLVAREDVRGDVQTQLSAAERLLVLGHLEDSYFIALETLTLAESRVSKGLHDLPDYMASVLLLVQLEYQQLQYNQARFHLRKLLYLAYDIARYAEKIGYWAICLDEIQTLLKREDSAQLIASMPIEYTDFFEFSKLLNHRKIAQPIAQRLRQLNTSDAYLRAKGQAVFYFAQLLLKQPVEQAAVNVLYEQYPQDFFIARLYAMVTKDAQLDAAFWPTFLQQHTDHREAITYYRKRHMHKKPKKDLSSCHITFLGGGEKIGGTSILVEVAGHRVLLDAGMHLHEDSILPDYTPLTAQGLTLNDLDAILITHAHIDHTGSLPYVHKMAPHVPIYMTADTASLMDILLKDSVRFNEQKVYDQTDVSNVFVYTQRMPFKQKFNIPAGQKMWTATFYEAGHILGAASIHLEIEGVSILFTGDFSTDTQRSCTHFQVPRHLAVDVLITESTYGYVPTNANVSRKQQERALLRSLQQTTARGGTFLIPAFAVGRAQEILCLLQDAFRDQPYFPFNVIVDGRVIDVCHVYEQARGGRQQLLNNVLVGRDVYGKNGDMSFDEFFTQYIEERGTCIIASSGMLNDGSASSNYAKRLVENARNTFAFTGYLDHASPGHQMLAQRHSYEPTVLLDGQRKRVVAGVEAYRLSAHVSREHLFEMLVDFQPQQVFLMHGEHRNRYAPIHTTTTTGETIYPSIKELLDWVEIDVICALNGEHYNLS